MKRQTVANGLWGALPQLAFFLTFPALAHALDQKTLDNVMAWLPVIAILSTFDFGIGRTLLRLTGRATNLTRAVSQRVLDGAICSVLVYGYGAVFIMTAAAHGLLNGGLSREALMVAMAAPALIISTVLSTYFDGQARFNVQNRRVNPILATQWPLTLLTAYLWPNSTLLLASILLPKFLALPIQWYALDHPTGWRNLRLRRLWRNAPWRANLLTSFMSPLCSNLDRLMVGMLAGTGAGTYVALSEISRRSSGLAKPLVRVISAGRQLGDSARTHREAGRLASAASALTALIALGFGIQLLNGYDPSLRTMRNQPLENLFMLGTFAAAAALQVQSLVRFMTATLAGRSVAIARYQLIQMAVASVPMAWLAARQEYALCAIAYLAFRAADYAFLRHIEADRAAAGDGR